MTRAWPIPHPTRTVHVMGDLHAVGLTATRLKIMRDDIMTAQAPALGTLQMGDMTNNGAPDDAVALNYMNSLGVDWWGVIGNHDIVGRTAAAAATAWGMPGKDYVIDLGFAAVVVIGPDTVNGSGMIYRTATSDWLDAALTTHATKPCVVACHLPFYGTVGIAADDVPTKKSSFDLAYYLRGETAASIGDAADNKGEEFLAVLEAHPNVKAWISGHTHSNIRAVDIVKPVTVAGRNFVHVNASAPQGHRSSPLDGPITAYLSILDDGLEVRYRNHGLHQWVGSGPTLKRVWNLPY